MTDATLVHEIKGFLERSFDGRAIGVDQNIFEGGFATSLFAMELVAFVESRFGIDVGPDDLDMANFESIARIAEMVARKRAGAVAA